MRNGIAIGTGLALILGGLSPATAAAASFGEDLAFLRQHTAVVVLASPDGRAQVAIAPDYQGRVLTSTASGLSGPSYGWINRAAIADGQRQPHINVFGGEDRFWLGPEGGQYSIYFERGRPFTLEYWQTPEPIDWGAWKIASQSATEVRFRRPMKLKNYSDTPFELTAERTVRLLDRAQLAERLGAELAENVAAVGYESENRITNTGKNAWQKETGLLSIWILGMLQHSEQTTVVVPFRTGPETQLGPVVNDAYFGKVPADRLKIGATHIFFRCDGRYRSKIGLTPLRAKPILGSYAADSRLLTIVQYTLPEGRTDYVNSMWEIQAKPYAGDAVNSYNDGPPAPGAKPLGPFYELESSSPAAALAPGESLTHVHRTVHLQGPETVLSPVAERTLGVKVADIQRAFAP
jgi:hypothetical protein